MSDVSKIYQERFGNTGLDRRDRVWKVLCSSFFNKRISPDETVLDLACGYGEFINNISAARKYGVDLNPDAPKHLNGDVTFTRSVATDLSFLPDESVDVVFTSNFLEHLRDKSECDQVFAAVRRILKSGGRFIVLGPNIHYAYREYWDYYDHYLPLSHLSLAEGLTISGFEIKEVIPRFLPYTMNNKTPTNDALIKIYLRLPIAWRFMGKQFLVTAIKK
ncbi:class I SAM-dependent methyltransferase [Ancylobacter moscoviensis]